MTSPHPTSLWVRTSPSVDGSTFLATLEWGQDRARSLDPDEALRYAAALIEAATRAQYDAAVARQLTTLGLDLPVVARVIESLRTVRAPVDPAHSAPLTLTPSVNHKFEPFITIAFEGGEPVGQWTPEAALDNALHVLEAVVVASLDRDYLHLLTTSLGLDEPTARATVAKLNQQPE